LAGCGFHLRGSVILPEIMTTTFIQDGIPASMILPKLKRALTKNDVNVIDHINDVTDSVTDNVTVDAPEYKSVAILQIFNENFNRRLLSSGSTTLVKEYQLNYAVTFSLRDYNHNKNKNNNENNILLPEQTINITREQTFDEAEVLSKTTEQQKLRQEMISDAVRQILRRLQSIRNAR